MRTILPILFLCVLSLCLVPRISGATADQAALCDHAAMTAAEETGVPDVVLRAITRAETGRESGGQVSPWPWAVNQAGKGNWFPTRDQALDHVAQAMDAGESNIDIGCFQVNIHWHGAEFASLEDMFDPVTNARYAAGFLARLYAEKGTWEAAIGAYHSRRDDDAETYLNRVAELVEAGIPEPGDPPPEQAEARVNLYPLLQPGTVSGALGSLVSNDATGAQPLFP